MTSPLAIADAIQQLDFAPQCEIPIKPDGRCDRPADFMVTTHWCLIVAKRDPKMETLLVCAADLDTCRHNFDMMRRAIGATFCPFCGATFSSFSDLVSQVVPL